MYSNIAPLRFFLGLVILSVPVAVVPGDWRARYVVLMLLSFSVFNARGLDRFASFVTRELR